MTEPQPFHDWLITEMERRRMSQRVLAMRSGVNHSTISRLLDGQRMPTYATISRLSDVFGSCPLHPVVRAGGGV